MTEVHIRLPDDLLAQWRRLSRQLGTSPDAQLRKLLRHAIQASASQAHETVVPEGYFERVSANEIRLKGTRIGIEHVLERYLLKGELPGEIAAELALALTQVYAVISYLQANRREAWCYLRNFLEWREKQERSLAARQAKRGLRDKLLRRL
ncbi:MAG: hypothetical protein NTW87_23355 [Planctomycetota bacterium]|nr:hypothetical protein [Planctomycetota bacterium]